PVGAIDGGSRRTQVDALARARDRVTHMRARGTDDAMHRQRSAPIAQADPEQPRAPGSVRPPRTGDAPPGSVTERTLVTRAFMRAASDRLEPLHPPVPLGARAFAAGLQRQRFGPEQRERAGEGGER